MDQNGNPPARPLYERIEEIRARRGLTWIQVARAAGVNRQTIYNLETQPRRPLPPTVQQIAEGLGIDPEEALQLAGYALGEDHKSTTDQLAAELAEVRAQLANVERELEELRSERRGREAG